MSNLRGRGLQPYGLGVRKLAFKGMNSLGAGTAKAIRSEGLHFVT